MSHLHWDNIGFSGCDASVDYLEYNLIAANGTPLISVLKSCCFQTVGGVLTTTGPFPCTMYRETARPYWSAGDIIFPATAGGAAPGSNIVLNGDFDEALGGINQGFASVQQVTYTGASNHEAARPWTTLISGGAIAPSPSGPDIAASRYWYGASTACSYRPFPYGAKTIAKPLINDVDDFLKLGTDAGQLCNLPVLAETGFTGAWQVIQGLTPGVTYELKVKFSKIPDTSDWGFGWGNDDLDSGLTVSGETYYNLGGNTAAMYTGANSSGTTVIGTGYYGTDFHPFYPILPDTLNEQTTSFVAQGGNEVLTFRYESYETTGVSGSNILGDYLEIEYIRIAVQPPAPFNSSALYGLIDIYDTMQMLLRLMER